MLKSTNILKLVTQHNSLNILLYTEKGCPLTDQQSQLLCGPRRVSGYHFLYITEGAAQYFVDDQAYTVKKDQLLFVVPHQICFRLKGDADYRYFKLLFDEECVALLPGRYSFLNNPVNDPVVSLDEHTKPRVAVLMQTLHTLIATQQVSSEIILSYLHPLLTEFGHLYTKNSLPGCNCNFNFHQFTLFKSIVERTFKNPYPVAAIAEEMALTTDSLNRLVQGITGISPKEYLAKRVLLEAKRQLYHHQLPVKELAYALGFSDPDYFSRFFKKHAGIGISEYLKKMQELYS